jgi:hypothetical protein
MGPTNPGAAAQSAAAALWLASILTDVVPQAPIMTKKHCGGLGLGVPFFDDDHLLNIICIIFDLADLQAESGLSPQSRGHPPPSTAAFKKCLRAAVEHLGEHKVHRQRPQRRGDPGLARQSAVSEPVSTAGRELVPAGG